MSFSKYALTILFLVSCSSKSPTTEICGRGTHDVLGTCVLDPSATCGPGTAELDGRCVPERSSSGDSTSDAGGRDGGMSVDVTTACLGTAENIFVLADNYDARYPRVIVERGPWNVIGGGAAGKLPMFVSFDMMENWSARFDTQSLGEPLAAGVYAGAQSEGSTDPNHPGISINGPGLCLPHSAQFTVIEISAQPADEVGDRQLQSFTVVFEEQCDFTATPNVGCLHFHR